MDIKFLKYVRIINSENNYFNRKLFYEIQMKKNKIKKFTVRDGIIKIIFDLSNLYCTYCRSNQCYHIMFIYKLGSKDHLWKCNNCHNLIHNKCIKEWIKQKNECPLCKQEIIKNQIF